MHINCLIFLKWRWPPPTPERVWKCGTVLVVTILGSDASSLDRPGPGHIAHSAFCQRVLHRQCSAPHTISSSFENKNKEVQMQGCPEASHGFGLHRGMPCDLLFELRSWIGAVLYTHLMLWFNEITYVKSLIECLACGRQTSDSSSFPVCFWVMRTLTYMYFNVLVWPMVWLNRKGFCRQVLCPRIWSRDIRKTRWEAHRWTGMGIHWNQFVKFRKISAWHLAVSWEMVDLVSRQQRSKNQCSCLDIKAALIKPYSLSLAKSSEISSPHPLFPANWTDFLQRTHFLTSLSIPTTAGKGCLGQKHIWFTCFTESLCILPIPTGECIYFPPASYSKKICHSNIKKCW